MSRPFDILFTPLEGLRVIRRRRITDERGFLARLFCDQELGELGWPGRVAQVNHTATIRRGTVRGLHFQVPPYAEFKLVSCIRGIIWDVAVDLRVGSPTFLKWYARELSAENECAMLIPEGFAHGFQSLTNDCEMVYVHSAGYEPDAESGIHVNTAQLGIGWPLPVNHLSKRDAGLPASVALCGT
jgi:dTDP-4-dehydrorhamnose 3,5-epimerase